MKIGGFLWTLLLRCLISTIIYLIAAVVMPIPILTFKFLLYNAMLWLIHLIILLSEAIFKYKFNDKKD